MVSDAHRFLAGRTPGDPGAHRIWVLHGRPVQDLFFHDVYHGCVPIWRSLALWAIHDWTSSDDADPPVVLLLKATGDLDFSHNADAEDAEARFHRMLQLRAPRYGHRRSRDRQRDRTQADGEESREQQQANEEAARAARAAAGGQGTGLINRMGQITNAFKNGRPSRILVMVELVDMLEGLLAQQMMVEYTEAKRIISRDWTESIDQTHAMVVVAQWRIEDLDRHVGSAHNQVNWEWTELKGPDPAEVTESLIRAARRRDFVLRHPDAVGQFLAQNSLLREAVGVAARVVKEGEDVAPASVRHLPPVDEAEVQRVMAEIDELVGLAEVKAKAVALVASARARRERLDADGQFPDQMMHMIFSGSAGTGKTTVAGLFARLFRALGMLSKGELAEAKTSQGLFDPAVGRTGQNMQALLQSALGGVLLLDEAHTLGQRERDRGDSPAMEAVKALVPMASDHRDDLVIILAMYASGMDDVLAMDEGLDRRFPLHGRFEFADYTPDELWTIMQRKLARERWQLTPAAERGLQDLLRRRSSVPGFGNAGGVDSLVTAVVEFHDARAGSRPGVLEVEDLPPVVVTRPEHIREAEQRLDGLVGLGPVRAMLEGVVSRLVYDAQEGDGVGLELPGMLFVGPPGTGKTTVAQLMAQLLYGHGVLDNRRCVTVTGAGLKAPYDGQSAEKVRETVAKARGGVLLIDEAYGIVSGDGDEFGKEAQAELLDQVLAPENRRTVFILAGYEAQVDEMVERNAGMARRFPTRVVFENFSPDECAEVARRVLEAGRYTWEDRLLEVFASRARKAIKVQGPVFGNAGWAETEIAAATDRMKARVVASGIPGGDPRRRLVLGEDFEPQEDSTRRNELLHQAEAELDDLVGLASVRKVLRRIVAKIKYLREEGRDDQVSLAGMLFVGPPGTGKTTVAELMAKLLHGHGVLDNDRCVTVTGADLKAGYRGQTTGRVHKIVRDAKGGVLLIDEAYGIVSGPQDEFGQEAQQELLKEVLSSANASTVFILAGYEADIDAMLTTNDGMPRRFPNKVRFENFTAADCAEVARRDLVAHDQTWEDGFLEAFARLARHTIKEQRDHFGNAGWAKNTIEAAVGEMILRIDEESIPVGDPRRRHVTIADLEEAAGRSLLDSDDESSESGPPTAWSGHVADLHFDWHAGEEAPELATFDEDLTEEREALRRVKEASVHMIVEFRDGQRGGASGFLVTADGLVVTNQHVVDNARNINVLIGPERIPLTGRIVSVARDGIDLALVQVTRPDGIRPLPLGFSAELGELDELLVVGNAAVEPGQSPRVVRASVSRNDPAQDPVHFETSGAIEEGFSGGAVAHSSSGAAVGVVVGGIGGTVKMIIRSEQVRLMLAELGYRFEEV